MRAIFRVPRAFSVNRTFSAHSRRVRPWRATTSTLSTSAAIEAAPLMWDSKPGEWISEYLDRATQTAPRTTQ